MIPWRRHVQIGAHLAVSAVLALCWLMDPGRPALVAVTTLTGTVLYTMADTTAHPERGGRRLMGTTIINLVFTMALTSILALLLPSVRT